MLSATGDCLGAGLGEVGEIGPGASGLGGCKVGIKYVLVYVATWKTEYTLNGKRAKGIWRETNHARAIPKHHEPEIFPVSEINMSLHAYRGIAHSHRL
jgi:hypothetical protein